VASRRRRKRYYCWMDGWMSTSPARSTAFFWIVSVDGSGATGSSGGRGSTSRSTATCLFRIDRRRECSIGIRRRFDAPPVSTREAREGWRRVAGSRPPSTNVPGKRKDGYRIGREKISSLKISAS
jgi:hypothetical protein